MLIRNMVFDGYAFNCKQFVNDLQKIAKNSLFKGKNNNNKKRPCNSYI